MLLKGPQGNESAAQIEAFDDTWHWTDAAEEAFGEVLRSGDGNADEMLRAMRQFLGGNDMMAYLSMTAVRLPARRDDAFRKAAREEDSRRQGCLGL